MTKDELAEVLRKHRAWLTDEDGGSRADLSRADLSGADLSGADLSRADLSGADLSGADLSGAYLRGADLSGAYLRGADLSGAYLRGADLRGAYLRAADLRGAYLSGADLSGADVPTVNQLHTKTLEAIKAGGKLDMNSWHTCATTHCRAGWAIVLAGEAGAKLELELGPAAAGALIALKSCPFLERVPNFYASNEDALADIRRCAELEQKQP